MLRTRGGCLRHLYFFKKQISIFGCILNQLIQANQSIVSDTVFLVNAVALFKDILYSKGRQFHNPVSFQGKDSQSQKTVKQVLRAQRFSSLKRTCLLKRTNGICTAKDTDWLPWPPGTSSCSYVLRNEIRYNVGYPVMSTIQSSNSASLMNRGQTSKWVQKKQKGVRKWQI